MNLSRALPLQFRHFRINAPLHEKSPFVQFFFGVYEKRDYLEDYSHIRKGLSSTEGKERLPDDNSLRSEFNFHHLDIGASLLKLRHLGLWDLKTRSPAKSTGPPKSREHTFDYSTSQLWHPTLVFTC